ncbi:arf-GAP with Rho-GAP domain, ANK repeat and PH domain-containing protein 2 [Chanos chanos]|uniref:Arf-GAP with Rho-GAP domain, ANK repeat and PH domain-containing protein 2 n=1 Tax=Chanos chanos TaxID=29144 RepID=A0A6J2VPU7_CHACN|nr:arf-GAP with Rho-GAP domain, ANK repeat and PH domain-containing protein 2 [Chanos chanos]
MSSLPEPSQEISSWLSSIHLGQYGGCLAQAGYHSLEDCWGMTEEKLLELGDFPTGHRRRILRSLEVLGAKDQLCEAHKTGEVKKKPVPRPRKVFHKDRKRGTSSRSQSQGNGKRDIRDGRQTLPSRALQGSDSADHAEEHVAHCTMPRPSPHPRPSLKTHNFSGTTSTGSSSASINSSSESSLISSHSVVSDGEGFPEGPAPSSPNHEGLAITDSLSEEPPDNFHGEMVENDIYERYDTKVPRGPRPTRSYRLRHRPVPEPPQRFTIMPQDWNVHETNSPKQVAGVEGSSGTSTVPKAPLERKLSPISPYGEIFLYNNPENKLDLGAKEMFKQDLKEKLKQKRLRKKQARSKGKVADDKTEQTVLKPTSTQLPYDDGYSTVQPHALNDAESAYEVSTSLALPLQPLPGSSPVSTVTICQDYSEPADALGDFAHPTPPVRSDFSISPYACFYGPAHKMLRSGWLDKLSPQGNCVFQRRWVKLDGENLTYYNNDKEMYSKGLIPIWAMKEVRGVGENKLEVVTSLRTFVFRAEKEGERQDWLGTLQTALRSPSSVTQRPCKNSVNRRGYAELRGHKGRVYVCLSGTTVRLCKTEQDYNAGLAITVVDLIAASVKHVDKRGFEITTPFKSFCFTVESEREREEWMEAVQESIVETLSDYEVAEKIWFNQSNRKCADCRAAQPEWASINLCVVICKKCAGQHRFLGPGISQVRSLKLDSSLWSNELVELFLEVGNENANSFWAANLPPEEELHAGASMEQRATFHRRKYRERKYRKVLEGLTNQEELNQALCEAVVTPDVLRTMSLVFSGADVMCATGHPEHSTPYLLAQRAGQRLQMEFLYHNKLSDFSKLEVACDSRFPADIPSFMDGFLYCSVGSSKATPDKKGRDDMVRRWCTLEGGFLSYYESERNATATGRVDIREVVSLAMSNTETVTAAGAVFTFEMYLHSERVLFFGAETADTHRDWAHAIAKCFIPDKAEALLRRDCELIGWLYYKEGHDLYHWRIGWFALVGSELLFCSGEEDTAEGELQLKRLQELTVSTQVEGEERIQVLLMVESGRTVYIHGVNKQHFALWHSAIQLAAGTDGRALANQQLSKNNIPIIIDSCIAFVTQYGLNSPGIYQKNGDPIRVAQLLDDFRKDARSVKLRVQEHMLEDVTETLKSFLSQCDDALLAKELYPYWVSALDDKNENNRVERYSTLIQSLPKINRSSLEALLQHLFRIQSCSSANQMNTHNLACVLSPCLFQTEGHSAQEVRVVEDLINNYIQVFSVKEEQVRQMERENCFITKWKHTAFSQAGDLIFEVYLEKKEPENCCLIKVSPTMHSDELVDCTLEKKSVKSDAPSLWTTYEVIENGELERPLHYKEKVLEQVLEWSVLDDPGSAHLIIKQYTGPRPSDSHSENLKTFMKGEHLKFKDDSSKLLSAHKFQDRYLVLQDNKLLLYKDVKNTKPEKEISLGLVKCYLGVKKKLKPTTSWGFTIYTKKQQWYFCCEGKESQLDWVMSIIRVKNGGDLWPKNKGTSQRGSRDRAALYKGPLGDKTQHNKQSYRKSDQGKSSQPVRPKREGESSHQNKPKPTSNISSNPKQEKEDSHPRLKTASSNGRNQLSLPISGRTKPDLSSRIVSSGGIRTDLRPEKSDSNYNSEARRTPSPLPDKGSVTKGMQRKPMLGCGGAQMPQNLLNELNSVLSKTRQPPQKES